MAEYAFVTRWSFQAPIESVWDLVFKAETWPEWWPGVERVEVLEKGADGEVGSLRRFTWKSRLPYKLRFEMRTTRAAPRLGRPGDRRARRHRPLGAAPGG